MGFLSRLFGRADSPAPRADAGWVAMTDPRLAEMLRFGSVTASGFAVNVETALRNTAMFRAVSLISYAIGMLPVHVIDKATKAKADDHPLFHLLHREPNGWQSAFDFRTLMQLRALVKGNAYALIVRSRDLSSGGVKVIRLVPLDPDLVEVRQADDWSVSYVYRPAKGASVTLPASEIFHLRGLTLDGLRGLSVVRQAAEAIGLALAAERASARLFSNGALVGASLGTDRSLSDEAFGRLRDSLAEKEGADNAYKTLILEEGLKWTSYASTARDAQMAEIRKLQVEEIARATGVPRPLLMVDETSWGSGIESLGRFFVQYGLSPWFEAWQQAAERSLLTETEKGHLAIKFNDGALLRGSIKDQADFFSKALGSGGAPGWMAQNEVRDTLDLPSVENGDGVSKGTAAAASGDPTHG